jgi:hypothetical protein
MKAAWYEKQGAARDDLAIGEMNEPQPLEIRDFRYSRSASLRLTCFFFVTPFW